jgi:hypothetical protein
LTTAPSVQRRGVPKLVVWLLWIAPAILTTLHSYAILPTFTEELTLAPASMHAFEGFAYTVDLPQRSYLLAPDEPAEQIFENGRLLQYPNMAGYGPVVTDGMGRSRINGDRLFFSTTDNTDPRVNGRTYTVVRPARVRRLLFTPIWLAAFVATLVIGVPRLPVIVRAVARPRFATVALLFAVLMIANRGWYFLDFQIPGVHPDSGSYLAAVESMGSGKWPNFGNRPPVYPLFLAAVFSVADSANALVVVQTALSIGGGFALIYAAYQWLPFLGLVAAGVISLYLSGSTIFEHDTSILSESLYTSLLMFGFAGLLVGIRKASSRWLAWASAAMALAILTRPAGIFLEVTYVIIGAWLLFNRFPRRAVAAFLIPFPVLLLAMCTYNWKTVGVFATTTWGEANLAGATLLAWQTDPEYPPEINESIEQIQAVIQKRYVATGKDPSLLDNSWDLEALRPLFLDGFNWEALTIATKLGGNYETAARPWIRRVSFDAVRKRPDVYAKFVTTMMYFYFKPFPDYDSRAYVQNRAWMYYVSRGFVPGGAEQLTGRLRQEFDAAVTPPPSVAITNRDPAVPIDLQDRVIVLPTAPWRVYDITHHLRFRLYDRWFWPIGTLVALLASMVVLARHRLRHHGAFCVFILSIAVLGASLVVSLVEWSQPRYSYPMEWAYGMSVVLLPLAFMKSRSDRDTA